MDAATPTRATSVRAGWIPLSAATNGNGKGYREPNATSWMPIRTYTWREEAEWRDVPAWLPIWTYNQDVGTKGVSKAFVVFQ